MQKTPPHTTQYPPTIIIISGAPATGKSTLAEYLADQLRLPLLMRDGIKDTLFATLGWSDRAWSQKLGGASWDLLFYLMEMQLKAQASFVAENCFQPRHHQSRFDAWQEVYPFEMVQIVCKADLNVCYDRFHARAISGERHPGHVDQLTGRDEFVAAHLARDYAPLASDGTVIEVDTTDFERVDYAAILAQIKLKRE